MTTTTFDPITADLDRRTAALHLFIQTYGRHVFWWGSADSPNSGVGIQLNPDQVLILSECTADALTVIPADQAMWDAA